jgi:hypothetical protein
MTFAKKLAADLALIATFFAFIGGAFLFCWLMIQANFGILEIAEFDIGPNGMTSQTFCTYMFATLSVSCMACAFGVMKMMDSRL